MNHREPSQVPTGVSRIGVGMALFIAFATAKPMHAMGHPRPAASHSLGRSSVSADGYLLLVGAPALRFAQEVAPAPSGPRPESIAPLKAAAVMSGPDIVRSKPAATTGTPPAPRTETRAEPASADKPAPLSILPDENRPPVRPEDFLPYFQIPGAVPRLINEPAPLPKSTATYTETTK